MPDATHSFFRVRLGTIEHNKKIVPVWLYNRPGAPETLQVTPIQSAGVVLPDFSAGKTIDRLKPLFAGAQLEAATFAEWIDQGGTPLERPEGAAAK